jgi:formimidoylglutamate deiminase
MTRDPAPLRPAPAAPLSAHAPTGSGEVGWLPDCVLTGEKFEPGVAFFADALGRISRFSREPADLARARRLAGQAAVPGLVNAHSRAFLRAGRGRAVNPDQLLNVMTAADVFDTARLAFMEMLLAGITCVGEFQVLHHGPADSPAAEANFFSHEILRAAHDVGIRISLMKVAAARRAHARSMTASADQFIRDAEALRLDMPKNHPADEAWLGIGVQNLATAPIDFLKSIAAYAHAQRLRLQLPLPATAAERQAVVDETRRTPLTLLAEHGIIDKRFTAVGTGQITDEDAKLLGSARATVCVCPTSDAEQASDVGAVDRLLSAGAGVAVGSGRHAQGNLLEDVRRLSHDGSPSPAGLLQIATVGGARSLGATGGALEVGRPADFFTLNLLDPSLAGTDVGALPDHLIHAVDRRAVHEVWIGARQRIAAGRHPQQGVIVSRFVEAQKRIWAG